MKTLKKILTRLRSKKRIDYIRRSTADAVDKMEHARIRCWKKTHRKNEMEMSIENRNITE